MEGTRVKIGRNEYIVPDATLDTAEKIAVRLEELSKGGAKTPGAIAEIIAIAVRENYPEIEAEDIARSLKLKDSVRVMKEVLVAVGLEVGTGEAKTP